ncbi:MAG: CinA family protein [Ghiorsea sp.]
MIKQWAKQLVDTLLENEWKIRCVESCTAGALSAAIGGINGASAVLDRSWVTYSNQAKVEEVGVAAELIAACGAVSQEVVLAMAEGAVKDGEHNVLSISISGVAGPTGGTAEKPVGTVWIGWKAPYSDADAQVFHFKGNRASIQEQAVAAALQVALQASSDHGGQNNVS